MQVASRSFKQAVVNNKGIYAVISGKRFNCIGDFPEQQHGKAKPVYFGIVQKAIEGILRKRRLEGTRLLLYVHASVSENIAELILEDRKNGNAFFFSGITLLKKVSNLKSAKK